MAIVSGTYESYQAIGEREDLMDIIFNIAPTDTPFFQAIGREKAENTLKEWQTDTLAAAAANAQLEGDEASFSAATPTKRLNNQTQILRKTVIVSGTNRETMKAGRGDELPYQIEKRSKELKRDIEFALTQNAAVTAGVSDTTARKSGGLETWLLTNTSLGSGGAVTANTNGQPNNTATPTDGTQRAFTEPLLQAVNQSIFTQGGNPTMLMVGPFNKRVASGFAGNATRTIDAEGARLQTSISVYEHDYGILSIVPNRFNRDRTATVIDPEYWCSAWLRPIMLEDLAKTGDADKRMLIGEMCLVAKNEASSGKVADLTTS